MTKKKACKKGCVDCNECLLKQKIKKQRIAKSKAMLKQRGLASSRQNVVQVLKDGVFDKIPKMQFLAKKREDKSITLGDLQNELRNFRLNQGTVSVAQGAEPLNQGLSQVAIARGALERPSGRNEDPLPLPLPTQGLSEVAIARGAFERPNDRNEAKYEDAMDNEDDTSLFTKGKKALFSFLNRVIEPEPWGLSPPNRQDAGLGDAPIVAQGAVPDLLPRLFQLPAPSRPLATTVREETKEEYAQGETKEDLPPAFERLLPPLFEEEAIDENEFEDVEFGGGLSNAEMQGAVPEIEPLPQPEVPVLQAQPDFEEGDENDPLPYEEKEDFTFGLSPEHLESQAKLLSEYRNAGLGDTLSHLWKDDSKEAGNLGSPDDFFSMLAKVEAKADADETFIKEEADVFDSAEEKKQDKNQSIQDVLQRGAQDKANAEARAEAEEAITGVVKKKKGRPAGSRNSTTIAKEAKATQNTRPLQSVFPLAVNVNPEFVPAVEATFPMPRLTRSGSSSLEKKET